MMWNICLLIQQKGKGARESTLINTKHDDAGAYLCFYLFENFDNTNSVLNLRESFN